jgi:hypothetical protein
MLHKCDACGFEFTADASPRGVRFCPECVDGVATPQDASPHVEVWARLGANYHRVFDATGPKELIDPVLAEMRTRTRALMKGAKGAKAVKYDGMAVMINDVITDSDGAWELPAPPEDTRVKQKTGGARLTDADQLHPLLRNRSAAVKAKRRA